MKYLASRGVSARAYKAIFAQAPSDWPPKIKRLVDMISSIMKDGRTQNLREWKAYAAVRMAKATPFNQTTPTVLNALFGRQDLTREQLKIALRDWGLKEEELFLKVKGANGQDVEIPNPPVFFQVIPPIVKSYTAAVLAKLFNARNLSPLIPYQPAHQNERDQVICEIVQDVVNQTAMNFGYAATLRQMMQQMLDFSRSLSFPMEEWYREKQMQFGEDGIAREVIVKEGLRYHIPDPTRFYYDLKHPLTSLNTDSGTEFAGYWHILSYGDVLDNRDLWNRKHIFYGTNWFASPYAGTYFTEYFPCRMKFPSTEGDISTQRREDKACYSTTADREKAIFIGQHFHKIIPRQWGLADYNYPVWHRFTMAADDCPLWVAPCGYTPAWGMGWDCDENAAENSSFALEVLPWQDMIGNLLTQMILTAKQNLTKVNFYDTNIVDAEDIRKLKNLGESMYRSIQWVGYDSLLNQVGGKDVKQAFWPVNLGAASIAELLQLLPTILNIMERVLQISAQALGSAASHQQGNKEIEQVTLAGSERTNFTLAAIDEAIDAMARQQYDAHMAYKKVDIEAEVSADIANVHQVLENLGFTVQHRGKEKILVHGTKSSLKLRGFARTSEGQQRNPDAQTAQVLLNVVGMIAGQPLLAQDIGAENLRVLLEFAAKLGGAPKDFKLKRNETAPEQGIPANVLQAIQQAQQAIMQAVGEKIAKPVAENIAKTEGEMQQVQGEVQQMQAALKKLEQIYAVAEKFTQGEEAKARQAQADAQIKAQSTAAELQRKEAEAATEADRKARETAAEQTRKDEASRAEQARKDREHAANLQRQKEQTDAKIEQDRRAAAAKADKPAKKKK